MRRPKLERCQRGTDTNCLIQTPTGLSHERKNPFPFLKNLFAPLTGLTHERKNLFPSLTGPSRERKNLFPSLTGLSRERKSLLQSQTGHLFFLRNLSPPPN